MLQDANKYWVIITLFKIKIRKLAMQNLINYCKRFISNNAHIKTKINIFSLCKIFLRIFINIKVYIELK